MTKYVSNEKLSRHQSDYFAFCTEKEKGSIEDEISSFGKHLKEKIEKAPFQWNGFGTLHVQSGSIMFEPFQINLPSLNTIPAQKVTRQNVQHNVLVGDQQMTSQEVTEALSHTDEKRQVYMIVGWTILVVAIAVSVFLLYKGNFQVGSAGLQR
jgi:hypothetical protein